MTTMNVSLPDAMKAFVDEQVAQRGYGTSSEYVRDLIRREQDRQALRALVVAGIASGRGGLADAAYFESLRQRVRGPAVQGAAAPARPLRKTARGR